MFRLIFIAALCIATIIAEEENKCSDHVVKYSDGVGVRNVACDRQVLKHGADLTSNIESVKDMTYFNVWLSNCTGEIDESSFPKLRDEITQFSFSRCNVSQFVLPVMTWLNVIEISDSNFPKLEADSFKNIPQLEYIDLINNVDLQIEPSPFKHLHNLKNLNINYQKIPHFTKDWLVGLDNLVRLSLLENGLETLDEDVFENSKELIFLNLKESKLTKIQPNTFKPLKNLLELNLLGTSLEDFSLDLLNEQKELANLGLPTKFLVKIGLERLKKEFPLLEEIMIAPEDEDKPEIVEIRKVAERLNIYVKERINLN